MRWFVLTAGGVATAAMLCISMRVNFLFGYSLGQTPERAEVFGWVSVISDFWKAFGPIFIVALFRAKKLAAVVASFIWAACLLYSVTSAVGAAIEDRSNRTGNRETIVMDYDEFTAEAKLLEEKRNDLRKHRPAPIVEAAITALLMRPVESSRRAPSTVGEVSANCQHTEQRTADACAEVGKVREELAAAKEENDLNREIAKLKEKARELRERGAIKSSDPQADLLAGLTGGWLSPRDVGRALALLLAMTIEFVSAFGPIVLKVTPTRRRDALPRGLRRRQLKPLLRSLLKPLASSSISSPSASNLPRAPICFPKALFIPTTPRGVAPLI
jgi:hypothetical protein